MSGVLAVSKAVASVDYGRLPNQMKAEVVTLLASLERIRKAGNKTAVTRIESIKLSAYSGTTPKSLERKYYKWRDAGFDWKALINKSKVPDAKVSLSPEFVEYWKGLCLQNGRKNKPAWRKLKAVWKMGRPIPGYDNTPPADPFTGIPAGWSYSNLNSAQKKPTDFEKTAARIGRKAAAKYRPMVLTTRVGLQPGQYYQYDDMWQDFKIHVPGERGSRRLISLHALDVFSGCLFNSAHKPTIYNEKDAKMEQLKEVEMIYLLANTLGNIGYHPDGSVQIAEHGTAAIDGKTEQLLYDCSGGMITVQRGGIEGKPVCRGMFAGSGKGNFRFKAALESLHSLIHNETADMTVFQAQTGSNARINAPDELYGRDKYHRHLLKMMDRLPEDRAEKIRVPFLHYMEAKELVWKLYDVINSRTEHKLEGWEKAGLVTTEWRLDEEQPWQNELKLLALPHDKQDAIRDLLDSYPHYTRCRKLSPAEVWGRGKRNLVTLPPHMMSIIFGERLGFEVKVGKDHTITFSRKEIDPEPMQFEAVAWIDGRSEALAPGQTFLGYINPIQPDELHITAGKGQFRGVCKRRIRVCRNDAEGLKRASGRAAKIESQLLKPVIRGQRPLIERQKTDRLHNAKAIKGDQRRRKSGDDFSSLVDEDENEESNEEPECEFESLLD